MVHYLLISTQETLVTAISNVLPDNDILQVDTLVQFQRSLANLEFPAEFESILVDCSNQDAADSALADLHQHTRMVYALVPDAGQRGPVLAAGADDYLLLPLLPAEIQARLGSKSKTTNAPVDLLNRQVIQNERLITIGRLVSSLCHEIMNRMQATRGALALALEELDVSKDMSAYISIGQQETQRVVDLVERMRQMYRPTAEVPQEINLLALLEEVKVLALDEVNRQNIKLTEEYPTQLPTMRMAYGRLQFAVLKLYLGLIALTGARRGGIIHLQIRKLGESIQLELIGKPETPFYTTSRQDAESSDLFEYLLGIHSARDSISASEATIGSLVRETEARVWLTLPV